jgi:hypothetical protein
MVGESSPTGVRNTCRWGRPGFAGGDVQLDPNLMLKNFTRERRRS